MGIFSSIKNAIFREANAEAMTSAPAPASARTLDDNAVGTLTEPVTSSPIDVAVILDNAAKSSGQKLEWRRSIVDLLKALKLDSSMNARKELANELGYGGDFSDSVSMNVWLHNAVIKKLSENGGQVPAELLD